MQDDTQESSDPAQLVRNPRVSVIAAAFRSIYSNPGSGSVI